VGVISTVNCSAFVTREITRYFQNEKLKDFPNVDGVIALTHPYGCGIGVGTENYTILQRTITGLMQHPNIGASLIVGLGCESNQASDLVQYCKLCTPELHTKENFPVVMIQDLGGIRNSVKAGIEIVSQLLIKANGTERTPFPLSELKLALQCGGSDAWSGVTANPLVGRVADRIVGQGGTVVLGETTEIFGAEHLLAQRAVSLEVN
jgi:altronate dehydratase